MKQYPWLTKFHAWRVTHLSDKGLLWLLSILVGFGSGLAAVALKSFTHLIQNVLSSGTNGFLQNYLYFSFPLFGMLLTTAFVVFLNRNKLGRGMSHILYAISKKSSLIERDKTYSHIITSALTVGFGGSVGLEAPIVTTGSAIGSNIGSLLHMDYKKRTLLIGCGAAGAIAGIFNAPIAGVIFTLEVLLLELSVPAFIPILLAAVTGNITTRLFLGQQIVLFHENMAPFDYGYLPYFILLGILCGLMSVYFTRLTYWVDKLGHRIKGRWSKALVGGVMLGLLILLFPALYGEGFLGIKSLLANNPTALFDKSYFSALAANPYILIGLLILLTFMKVFAMNFTIGGGGNGGIFAPTLFVGSVMGFLFAFTIKETGLSTDIATSHFTLVGMAGLVSGVMHAPLTGLFMIAEMTSSYELIVPLMLVSATSYGTVKLFEPHSVFTKQLARRGDLLAFDKDRTVLVNLKLKRVIETDLLTIEPDKTLGDLVEVVAQSKRNIFPVVDAKGKFHGIILLDDIRTIMFKMDKYKEVFVKKLMHPAPAIISPEEGMEMVMRKFQETGAWNLPVVDEDGMYVGFLSKSKIFNVYRQMLIRMNRED